ncbi:DUF3817 domain-containing protein [Nocardioides abyssi]|uniref:DUF3817 domain-containing protein n=1 Tax=Nocardioides abyssi TaxID=3058370 RepID=A0ABT8ERG5_9ACTN|nr:DUF3817 domain-containing protein [Nocardioides abyssi]MDN4160752.1 DUF3817 domain-containing protein [Nocardioides abyssi]
MIASPNRLFRIVATAEAITWAGLLAGMFLKYVTDTTELGVQVFGPIHGAVFIAYCVTTVVVAVDQRWSAGRLVGGLAASVPPFLTLWFERYAGRHGLLADSWRLRSDAAARSGLERPVGWLVRNPAQGLVAALVAVVALFGIAMLAGPPVG